jgi:ABC-type phosphate transport system substrate-binding protein
VRNVTFPQRVLVFLALTASVGAEELAYKLVVNAANPQKAVTRKQVSAFFLKKQPSWPDGTAVSPVEQSAASPIRAAFSKQVVGQSIGAVLNYWQQQIFSGRDVPPPVKGSDQEVMAFVQANRGAIGYVSLGTTPLDGTKVLKIGE